jgi:outer membrane protein TolC
MKLCRRLSFVVVLFVSSYVAGQESLSLQQAVDFAFEHSPAIRAAKHRVGAAAGFRHQAGAWTNPRLLVQSENIRGSNFDFANDSDTYVTLSQMLELPGKRSARVDIAQAGYRRAELIEQLVRREVRQKVKNAYWKAVAAERTRELLNEYIKGMDSLVAYHEARVREGAMPEADLLRVQLERERLQIDLTSAALEAQRSVIDLFREMGSGDIKPIRLTDRLDDLDASPVEIDVEAAIARRQEVSVAKAGLEQALANERYQRATARPDLDFIGGYKRTAGMNTGVVGLAVNLPLFDRNRGNIEASSAEVQEARALVSAAETSVRAEVLSAAADYEARRKQVSTTLRLIRDHASETADIARAAYREGGIDLLRLIDSERLRIDSELVYYRALSGYQQSVANVESAMGVSQ